MLQLIRIVPVNYTIADNLTQDQELVITDTMLSIGADSMGAIAGGKTQVAPTGILLAQVF